MKGKKIDDLQAIIAMLKEAEDILSGVAPEKAVSKDALANPAAIDFFVALAAR